MIKLNKITNERNDLKSKLNFLNTGNKSNSKDDKQIWILKKDKRDLKKKIEILENDNDLLKKELMIKNLKIKDLEKNK